ncbi:hypothetical protein CRG98_005832 [Punica granatum]|uniref:non-specific serine/threonine protein kinase n=1 Tax=Punica granatum TaxID=22663 RepID=A0A2I0KZ79_PUNGR|nr:hypothetical protein CRG98_005832 [Punica granatum]
MWFPFPLLLVHCSILVISFGVAESSDTLSFNQTLSDGQTLVSSGQVFELGFFSPGTSRNRYLGMWYRNLTPTYVWVANRNDPIVNSTAELALTQDGSLSLRNGSTSYWSVNTTAGASLQLLDDGNLVLKDDSGNYLWQSYDNVTDTLLPGMKLGWSLEKGNEEDLELPLFDLVTINSATNEFSSENKIGQGGFGKVYKGALSSGQEIAVKRLSLDSGQGIQEFKNEVILIAKLQHRNLVKLLGCCIQGEERMLIYEFMPNKSLDHHLFDKTRSKLLSWDKRFNIIMGIARGLLYLHQDSRLRIIHRDLKPSNILLDSQMNPKISDFGIARIFQGEQTGEITKRVFGTYGYIAPEYALRGHISVKSDVFSFGVLVLEIVSGKKIMGFSQPDNDLNLLGYAWKLWNEGNPLELVDEAIGEPFPLKEVVRCIQVGLLCAQLRAEDRPMMSTVVLMLGNENFEVPQPKEPGFKNESMFIGSDSSSSANNNLHTFNEITITNLDGR